MALIFEWDNKKDRANQKKHGVSFSEAMTIFGDRTELMISDPEHSDDEERLISVGLSSKKRLLLVVYTEQGDRIRLISARRVTRREKTQYEKDF
jgi:uncharacterized DUF497 family protein